jgi:hypothetical protein
MIMQFLSFAPFATVTRAQFAKMLAETFAIEGSAKNSFTDVNADEWYAPYVGAASEAGIINGYPDGTFGVNNEITRQDAAVMIARALMYKNINCEKAALSYGDNDAIASYATEAVEIMLASGIMSGRENNSVAPYGNMTRAEAATVFYRVLKIVEGR